MASPEQPQVQAPPSIIEIGGVAVSSVVYPHGWRLRIPPELGWLKEE